MPNATVPTDAQHEDLKSLEGAYVELKPLPYGELLERRDKASRMSMEAGGGRKRQDTSKVDIDMMQAATRLYEFQHCIVDHNLEDDKGNKLNFSNPATLNILSPKVGQEIEMLIDKLNELEDLDEENFTNARSSSTRETRSSPTGSTSENT